MKSMIVPFSIHSEIIIRVCKDLVAPSSGNRFGCLNCFHSTTSWQNFCLHPSVRPHFETERRTLSTLTWLELGRISLIATLEPRYHPRNTSALPPRLHGSSSIPSSSLVIAYEDGNNLCLQHIFLRIMEKVSRSEAHRPESSREPLFTLASYDGRRLLRTHLLQIINNSTGQLAWQVTQ